MPRAAIFDLDGLLIDSEPLWVRAEMRVFGEVGLALTEADCALTKGLRTDDVIRFWYGRKPWSAATPAEVEARLIEAVAALVRTEGNALPGIAHALTQVQASGHRLALASSSPLVIIEAALSRLGLTGVFEVVSSAERLPLGKPHPEVFLVTAQKLDVPAQSCVVFEDSVVGALAAKAAQMKCVAVPPPETAADARFAIADVVLPSLTHLSRPLLEQLHAKV
jgi:sugar-phosphatase